MIRLFIYSLLALIIGLVLSVTLKDDPGYVLISFQNYSIETSAVASVIAAVLVFILVSGVFWIIRVLNPAKLFQAGTWQIFNSAGKARAMTEKGLLLLARGQWQEAYKLLLQAAGKVEIPLANYLAAALAAFQTGDRASWIFCLDQAGKHANGGSDGINSLKALLELKSGQLEQSLAILLEIKKTAPANQYVQLMIKDIYVSLSDWEHLAQLMPELEKNNGIKESELISLQEKVIVHQLELCSATDSDSNNLHKTWSRVSKKLKNNEVIAACYLRALHESGDDARVAEILTKYLKNQWSDKLVELVGYIDSQNPRQQLLLLENWIKSRPNSTVLAMTLGRISLRNKLWGKAREYFEKALLFSKNEKTTAEINAELGRLLEHMGEHEKSTACYRKAIEMNKKLPDLPMP